MPESPADPASALPLTYVAYHVLLSLARGSRHGYGIIKDVTERTEGRVELQAGTLYAAVKRMKDDGWIEPTEGPATNDGRRRSYAITAFGREVLLAESRRLEALVALARDAAVLPGPHEAEG